MKILRSIFAALALVVLTAGSAFAQCGTTAPANKFCGNDTGAQGLAQWRSIPPTALSAIAGGTVLGNRTGASAVPTAVTNPVLGIPGTSTGEVGLAGATSGTAILRAQAAAGSAVSLLPTSAGTLVGTASSPLVINATSGLMTCPTCVTSSGGGAITGTAPISVSAGGVVSINAPYTTLIASNGGIVYSGATNLAILAGTATAQQMLQSGASGAPAWSTAAWPSTTTINQILYSSAANTVTGLATLAGGVVNANGSGVPSVTRTPVLGLAGTAVGSIGFQNATSGTVTLQPVAGALGTVTINIPAAAGTMAVSATAPITLSAAGVIGVTGAALTKTDDTNVTLTLGGTPASALLAATSLTLGWTGQLGLTRGGTAASLTASNGGIVYSTASALAILAGTATANQHLASGAGGAPSWTTATFPATTAAGTVLASASANAVTATATPTLGANGGTGGQITLNGATSGSAAIKVAAAAGATNFQLPVGNGSSGQVLSTDGSGNTSWISAGGTGTVTSVQIIGAGLTVNSGTCTITSTGACTLTTTAATQANMETATDNTVAVTPGRTQYHPGVSKAWSYVTVSGGVCTVQANYNAPSCTYNSVGNITVSFNTAFSSSSFACTATATSGSSTLGIPTVSSQAAGSITIVNRKPDDSQNLEAPGYRVVCFGDQ